MTTKKSNLQHQIDNAEKVLKTWPEWMKVSGQFQGSERPKNRQSDYTKTAKSK